jgi:hypothetical protein
MNAVRTNGSSTAAAAQDANRLAINLSIDKNIYQLTRIITPRDILGYLEKLVDKRSEDLKDDIISTLIVEQVRLHQSSARRTFAKISS